MSEGTNDFDSDGGLGAAWKAPAAEADVPPTVVEILAEWLQEIESCLATLDKHDVWDSVKARPIMAANATRIRSILDAKDETK